MNQTRYDEAAPLLDRTLEIQETALGPAHPALADTVALHSSVLRELKRKGEAEAMEDRGGTFGAQRAPQVRPAALPALPAVDTYRARRRDHLAVLQHAHVVEVPTAHVDR